VDDPINAFLNPLNINPAPLPLAAPLPLLAPPPVPNPLPNAAPALLPPAHYRLDGDRLVEVVDLTRDVADDEAEEFSADVGGPVGGDGMIAVGANDDEGLEGMRDANEMGEDEMEDEELDAVEEMGMDVEVVIPVWVGIGDEEQVSDSSDDSDSSQSSPESEEDSGSDHDGEEGDGSGSEEEGEERSDRAQTRDLRTRSRRLLMEEADEDEFPDGESLQASMPPCQSKKRRSDCFSSSDSDGSPPRQRRRQTPASSRSYPHPRSPLSARSPNNPSSRSSAARSPSPIINNQPNPSFEADPAPEPQPRPATKIVLDVVDSFKLNAKGSISHDRVRKMIVYVHEEIQYIANITMYGTSLFLHPASEEGLEGGSLAV
jgi:hypothetical protein